MRVVLAGVSGFLGSRLTARLTVAEHTLLRLVRRPPAGPDEIRWWPERGELDPAGLAGADIVINMAGAGVEDRRWTARYKATLVASRVDTTTTLARALAALPAKERPGVMLNASGVDYYGDTGDTEVDESAPPGEGFLGDLCQQWEAATRPAVDAGVRVALLRTGLPLDAHAGLLKPILLQFRLGAGGRMGSGRQWMPWISMTDWVDAVRFLMDHEVSGPVNLTGPAPCTNQEFAKTIADVLRRPALLWVPKVALRVILGEFGEVAVGSRRVVPGVLNTSGFAFRHPTLRSAVRAALGKPTAGDRLT